MRLYSTRFRLHKPSVVASRLFCTAVQNRVGLALYRRLYSMLGMCTLRRPHSSICTALHVVLLVAKAARRLALAGDAPRPFGRRKND